MLCHAERGTHLVLGTVSPDDELDLRHRHVWLARHRLHIGHPQVYGANFGIRADTYVELGAWPAVASGEDVAMAHRAAVNSPCVSFEPRQSPSRPALASPHEHPTASAGISANSSQRQPPCRPPRSDVVNIYAELPAVAVRCDPHERGTVTAARNLTL
jgi:hypothetical protein